MAKTKTTAQLNVVLINGVVEMSFLGETVYVGPPISPMQSISAIRTKFGVGLPEAKACWDNRLYLGDN